jgi:serine/threonine-protein kinase
MSRSSPATWGGDLPAPILLAFSGLLAITAVVIGAVGVRALVSDGGATDPRPTAAASATAGGATPSGSTTARSADPDEPPPPSDPVAAREARAKVASDLQMGRYVAFVTDLDELLRIDPGAAREREIRSAVVDVLMVITASRGEHVDQLYEIIERRMGTHGIDLLYELMTTRGGSRAAKRANELLADPEVRKRGSPALRVAYELRTVPCSEKNQLFERAKEDGDRRTLGQLEELKECRRTRCCLHTKDPALKDALDALRERFP